MLTEELFDGEDMETLYGKLSDTKKCQKCGRFVKYPCNNEEGFYTDGPWDWACDMYFNRWRYEF